MTPSPIRLYVIGDSISVHYGPFLEAYLSKRFMYDRKGKCSDTENLEAVSAANGGDSRCVKEYLASAKPDCDVLMINCGLHDIKTVQSEKQISPGEYRRNLMFIVSEAQKRGQKVIWIHSTPVPDERHNSISASYKRYDADIREYNAIAAEVMALHQVPVIDLYTFTAVLGDEIYCDHIHYKEPMRKCQAAYIAGYLESAFDSKLI